MSKTVLKGNGAVFDFDGTLVDSFTPRKNAHKKVSVFLLDRIGRHSSETDVKRMYEIVSKIETEMNLNKVYDRDGWWPKVMKRYADKPIDLPESTIAEASALYWESIKKRTTVYHGVPSMLDALKHKNIKLGIISDTDGLKGMKMGRIEASGLAKLFDAIVVAGEDTVNVKPDPEPYTLIAEKMEVSPESCISIGDNPSTDVDGALRTRMRAVIIKNENTPQTGLSQRFYAVERKNLVKFIISKLRQKTS